MDDDLRVTLIRAGKEMVDGGYITAEEFEDFKKDLMAENAKPPVNKFYVLREIKALVDDGYLSEDDYAAIKKRFFSNTKIGSPETYKSLVRAKELVASGILTDEDYDVLKDKLVSGTVVSTPSYDPVKELGLLEGFCKLLQDGLIDEADYDEKKKKLLSISYLNDPESFHYLYDYKKLCDAGIIEASDYSMIKSMALDGSSRVSAENAHVLKDLFDTKISGCISDEEFSEFKDAFIHGRKIPAKESFDKLKSYHTLLDRGLIDQEDYDNIKDCIYQSIFVRPAEELDKLEEYRKLHEEGLINDEEYKSYKDKLLPAKPKHSYQIKSSANISKKKKKVKKIIIMIIALIAVVIAALIGLAVYGYVNQDKFNTATISSLKDAQFGKEVTFGNYHGRPLKWYVAGRSDKGCYLLVAKSTIGLKPYNDVDIEAEDLSYAANEWSETSLRKWLNEDFYSKAFSDAAKENIVKCRLFNDIWEGDAKSGGENTVDHVFILSYSETNRFLKYLGDTATDYWLRNPYGDGSDSARYYSDELNEYKSQKIDTPLGVRPAIWVSSEDVAIVPLRVEEAIEDYSSYGSGSGSYDSYWSGDSDEYDEDGYKINDDLPEGWHDNPTGNGYINDDGYVIYNNNGVMEITDGRGNWAQDTDGDGNLDTYGSDNY